MLASISFDGLYSVVSIQVLMGARIDARVCDLIFDFCGYDEDSCLSF